MNHETPNYHLTHLASAWCLFARRNSFLNENSINMPLVKPLSPEADLEVKELAEFFNETLAFVQTQF